jgi:hypothetical protein
MTDVTGSWWHPALALASTAPGQWIYTENTLAGYEPGRQDLMNAITGDFLPAAMRASDADRDAVLSDLSQHFQAGRLTAAELDERTGRALTARTWDELGQLVADFPPAPAASQPSAYSPARPHPSGHMALPRAAALAGIAIAAVVLTHVPHGGWGLIWPLLAVLLIARPMIHHHLGTSASRMR